MNIMLDVELIRREPEKIKKGIANKNTNPNLVDEFLNLDQKWRGLVKEIDDLRAKQKISGNERNIEKSKDLKTSIKKLELELSEIEQKRNQVLLMIPNLPLPEAPLGKDETQNKVLREVGEKPKFHFPPKDYLAIAEDLGLIDVKRVAKVSGSRFGYLLKEGALLEFALVNFALSKLVEKGFIPIIPPVLINENSMRGMGYLERGREEVYYLPEDKLYLAGTSEQAIGPLHQEEVFEAKDLPRRYVAFSSCFRREAGSYGRDTKGILRVHQFDKLEMFVFTDPQKSAEEHKFLLSLEEELMRDLKIPYRVLEICTGDLGDPAAAKYDIEAWLPGQNNGKGEYRETHSTSNTTDFQARRLDIKVKNNNGTTYVHMLNGTAFAIGRMIIAIIENYQTEQGAVRVPEVLKKYLGIDEISRSS